MFDLSASFAHDPWFTLYFPAVLGDTDLFHRTEAAIPELPREQRGDALAVAARGHLVLRAPREAMRCFDQARQLGGAEVDRLAEFVLPNGAALAARRAATETRAGLAADAYCDLAALCLIGADPFGAQRAVTQALTALPEHAEARRWRRFLARPDAHTAAMGVLATRPSRRARGAAPAEAEQLLPTRRNGFWSPERGFRRPHFRSAPGPFSLGTARDRLEDAGIFDSYLATAEDYERVAGNHALATEEIALDQALSLAREGHDPLAVCTALWQTALDADDPMRVADLANVFASLGTRAPSVRPLGRIAAERMAAAPTSESRLFEGYATWYAAMEGDPAAAERAERLLQPPLPDSLSWRLGLGALAALGKGDRVQAHLRAGLEQPTLRALARSLQRQKQPIEALRVECGPRINPRGLGIPSRQQLWS